MQLTLVTFLMTNKGNMEPIDSDFYHRQEALSLAVQFLKGRMGFSSADVIEIADEFLNWINNVEVQ